MEALEILVDAPGGDLAVVDGLHGSLGHPSQVTAAEDPGDAKLVAQVLICTI